MRLSRGSLARVPQPTPKKDVGWCVPFERRCTSTWGTAAFAEYVERVFGYKSRTTQEKLRVAEALESLPELARRSTRVKSAGARCAS
jgi:hypothetical protein